MARTKHQPNLPREEERDLTQDSGPHSRKAIGPEPKRNADDGEDNAGKHPKPRKDYHRNEDKPNSVGVLLNFRSLAINVAEDRDAEDQVNASKDQTFGGDIHDHLVKPAFCSAQLPNNALQAAEKLLPAVGRALVIGVFFGPEA